MKGKTDNFVLDFANDEEVILDSFQPYYSSTRLDGETDPNKLYDIETQIKGFNLFTQYEVDEWCKIFFQQRETDEKLQPILNQVVEKWESISDEEQKEEFRSIIHSYCRLYSYISQIVTFEDIELEKLFIFLKFLKKKLPKRDQEYVDLSDSVDLDSLRIQKIGEVSLKLVDDTGVLEPMSEYGTKPTVEEEKDLLSHIIEQMNEIYGEGITQEHKIYVARLYEGIREDQEFQKVRQGDNSRENIIEKLKETYDKNNLKNVNKDIDVYKTLNDERVKSLLVNIFLRGLSDNLEMRA